MATNPPADPWAKFRTAQQPVNRDPIVAPAPPSERRAQESQRLERERLGIAQEGNERQNRAEQRGAIGEQQAFTLVSRVGGGIEDINYVYETWPGAKDAPSAKDTVLYNSFGPNSIVTRGLTEEGRRALEDTQRDIIDALLTLGTGAAYTDEQLETYRASYFPQFNDSEEMIALKRRRLQRAFEQAIPRAGPLGERLRQYQTTMLGDGSQAEGQELNQATERDQAPLGFETGFDRMGQDPSFDRAQYLRETYGIEPEGETRLIGLLNANRGNPNLTMESLRQIYTDAGVPMPDEAGMQDLLSQMRENRLPATAIDTNAAKQEYQRALDAGLAAEGVDPNSAVDSSIFGTARGVSLGLSDEFTGLGEAVGAALQGQDPIAAYQVNRDLVRRMAERSREESPWTAYGTEIAGGIVTGLRGGSGVRSALDAAKVGAVEGGIAGYGYGEGLTGSAVGTGVGVATGGVLGATVQSIGSKATNALLGRELPDAASVRAVTEAGGRRGVTVRRADVDPSVRGTRADLMQTDGRQTLRSAEADDLAEMETALLRNLGTEGAEGVGATFSRGERIQSGVRNVVRQARVKAGKLYDEARALSKDIKVEPRNALRVVNEQIAELEQAGRNSNKQAIEFLEGLRGDIARSGGVGIDVLRGQRTNLRGNISTNNLSMTDTERRASIVLDALSEDIKIGLKGNPALGKFRQADEVWRKQADFQRQVVSKLVGTDANPVPAETAARRIQAFIKGDYSRAKAILDELPADARMAIKEQVAISLGRGRNGEFSLGNFLTHTGGGNGNLIPPQAQRVLFGEEGVEAIKDLRLLAAAKRDAADPSNRSNTGNIVQRGMRGLRRLILGSAGFGIAVDAGGGMGVGTLAAGATALGGEMFEKLGQQRSMRLLLDPDFTKWLKKLPNSSEPQVINRWLDGVRSTASRSPVMTADIQAFERVLLDYANDNMTRAAAAEEPTE